jgi:hypothetical protein
MTEVGAAPSATVVGELDAGEQVLPVQIQAEKRYPVLGVAVTVIGVP